MYSHVDQVESDTSVCQSNCRGLERTTQGSVAARNPCFYSFHGPANPWHYLYNYILHRPLIQSAFTTTPKRSRPTEAGTGICKIVRYYWRRASALEQLRHRGMRFYAVSGIHTLAKGSWNWMNACNENRPEAEADNWEIALLHWLSNYGRINGIWFRW